MAVSEIKEGLQILRNKGPREFTQEGLRYFFPIKHLRARTAYLSTKYDNYAEVHPSKVIYIRPKNVAGVTSRRFFLETFDPEIHRGSVSSGKWDKNPIPVSNRKEYEVILDQQKNLPDINKIRESIELQAESSIDLNNIDEMFKLDTNVVEYPLTVNIDRNGQFQINSGIHQYIIAKVAGLDMIPCQVAVRHKKWQRFRDQVEYYLKHHRKGYTYNELPHADMGQWNREASHNSSERFMMVKKGIDINEGTVLDIGSHMDGYFSFELEEEGFNCCAVEHDKQKCYFLRKFRDFNDCEFQIVNDDITESEVLETHYDICLALNVFHHLMKTESRYQGFIELLERLEADCMIVQIITEGYINSWESRGNTWHKKFVEDDFVEHIIENSNFSEYECLGRIRDDGRPFYKLM